MSGKDKQRRNAGSVPTFVKALLFVTPLAYIVAGYGFPVFTSSAHGVRPGAGAGGGAGSKESGFAPVVAAHVDPGPVPARPRSIIKFFDGNTVITCVMTQRARDRADRAAPARATQRAYCPAATPAGMITTSLVRLRTGGESCAAVQRGESTLCLRAATPTLTHLLPAPPIAWSGLL